MIITFHLSRVTCHESPDTSHLLSRISAKIQIDKKMIE
jgi:hypothetical protein